MRRIKKTVQHIRQPEYTGQNRCLACTVVNIVIAVAVSVVVGLLTTQVAGTIAFVACLGAIYFRGYLVPGTPTLTKQYLPNAILRLFEKEPLGAGTTGTVEDTSGLKHSGSADTPNDLNTEAVLLESGLIEECKQRDDLCLSEIGRSELRTNMNNIREGGLEKQVMGELLDVDSGALHLEDQEESFLVWNGDQRVGEWDSQDVLIADLAVVQFLQTEYSEWECLNTSQKSEILYGFRIFMDFCPACGGSITASKEAVDSCCRSVSMLALECEDCALRLFETSASP